MSPEEMTDLDQLLSGDEPGGFSLIDPKVTETAAELTKAFFTGGSEAWGILLGRGVLYNDGEMKFCPPADVIPADLKTAVVTTIKWGGTNEGECYLIMPELGAKATVAFMMALMMGIDAEPETTLLDDEGMDAYNEAVNNLLGSGSQAMRGSFEGELNLTAAGTKLVDFEETTPAAEFGNNDMLCHTGQLTIEGLVPFNAYFIAPLSVTGLESPVGGGASNAEISSAVEEAGSIANKDLILKVKVPVKVILAEKMVRMAVVRTFSPGSIIEFRKLSGELLDISANEVKFGEGEVVIINGHFGIQLRRMVDIRAAIAQGA
ncbi:MAG: FliM/FliN family flagellar motor switch protein [Planctomycetes bacterium]|nr:FliM/FliN family flagellar motor switch protein [Planctomycetota bacterium]